MFSGLTKPKQKWFDTTFKIKDGKIYLPDQIVQQEEYNSALANSGRAPPNYFDPKYYLDLNNKTHCTKYEAPETRSKAYIANINHLYDMIHDKRVVRKSTYEPIYTRERFPPCPLSEEEQVQQENTLRAEYKGQKEESIKELTQEINDYKNKLETTAEKLTKMQSSLDLIPSESCEQCKQLTTLKNGITLQQHQIEIYNNFMNRAQQKLEKVQMGGKKTKTRKIRKARKARKARKTIKNKK